MIHFIIEECENKLIGIILVQNNFEITQCSQSQTLFYVNSTKCLNVSQDFVILLLSLTLYLITSITSVRLDLFVMSSQIFGCNVLLGELNLLQFFWFRNFLVDVA